VGGGLGGRKGGKRGGGMVEDEVVTGVLGLESRSLSSAHRLPFPQRGMRSSRARVRLCGCG